uniref:NADH dehydrogenase subunit 3 n=1 Tax=Cavelerius yunnanensis TaxID=2969358 RepID=UPI0020522C6C|nr:NADH dehydrogenase subunit 3 [Cavelerius yunnanensis]UPL65539.1 NADH dehydrogenase subunit 3 [Cavelerius excavatus]UUJ37744.1 NADH dehydrogenase subunit 3 [Cavelerius yunnanensis]
MFKILYLILLSMLVPMTLMMVMTMMSKTSITDREKMSPFECGFDPKSKNRLPFSIQFFLIAVLFLIFDVEVAIMLPMIMTIKNSNMITWTMTMTMFIMILIMGLYHEWNNNMLDWTK